MTFGAGLFLVLLVISAAINALAWRLFPDEHPDGCRCAICGRWP